MYKKREYIFIGSILVGLIFLIITLFLQNDTNEENENIINESSSFTLHIEGEVVRPAEINLVKPITYEILFLKIKNILNEYSDLASFIMEDKINQSQVVRIPSLDTDNSFSVEEKIKIHEARLVDLTKLSHIGKKRAQKILDYIKKFGKIESWDIFFEITSVPENAKDIIKSQAIL